MRLSDAGIELLKNLEGFSTKAYREPDGSWSIGYGCNGSREGEEVTREEAEKILCCQIAAFERGIDSQVIVDVTQQQFDALVIWAYNVGLGAAKTSTLLRKLNAGDAKGAAEEFLRWDKSGGKVLPGLVRRRERERALFLSDGTEEA